jgi:hypothetical protein
MFWRLKNDILEAVHKTSGPEEETLMIKNQKGDIHTL